MTMLTKFILYPLIPLAFAFGINSAHAESQVDPALIQALQQATQDSYSGITDLDRLVWLSSMAEKLEERIPNAFYRIRLLETVLQESEANGLDPQLVLAVIDIESNFNRYALSHAGAQGLMQVMPFWKNVHGQQDDDLFNPLVSLRYGCKILRHYLNKHPDLYRALGAYNGSLGRKKYPKKVFGRLARQWGFKVDQYSRNFSATMATAATAVVPPVN